MMIVHACSSTPPYHPLTGVCIILCMPWCSWLLTVILIFVRFITLLFLVIRNLVTQQSHLGGWVSQATDTSAIFFSSSHVFLFFWQWVPQATDTTIQQSFIFFFFCPLLWWLSSFWWPFWRVQTPYTAELLHSFFLLSLSFCENLLVTHQTTLEGGCYKQRTPYTAEPFYSFFCLIFSYSSISGTFGNSSNHPRCFKQLTPYTAVLFSCTVRKLHNISKQWWLQVQWLTLNNLKSNCVW